MSSKLPNIILMVLDTVGAKHLSLYGYKRPTTPNLERIAQECTVYTRCFSSACWTVPSHASMFTGLHPSQHGAFESRFLLRDNLPHLVPALKASGYDTIGISTNSLVSPASGLCQDFDEFHDLGAEDLSRILQGLQGDSVKTADPKMPACLQSALSPKAALASLWRYLWETRQYGEVGRSLWKMLRRQAAKWLKPRPIDNATPYTRKTVALMEDILTRQQTRNAPFFLFVNLLQAHQNYCPPVPRRRFSGWHHRTTVSPQKFYLQDNSPAVSKLVTTYANLYDDEILYLDSVLGRLWQVFQSKSLLDDTVIIITSDHGEHFGEHGHYTHIMSLYNELLWVPLIAHFPWSLAMPAKDQRLVSLNDLYATILDLVDSPLPRPTSSYSLLGPPQREVAIAQCVYPEMWQRYLEAKQRLGCGQGETFSPPIFAIMTDKGLKVVEKRDGSLEVYNLTANLIETEDLAPGLPPAVLENYRHLLKNLKTETGFHEATAGMLAIADCKAS